MSARPQGQGTRHRHAGSVADAQPPVRHSERRSGLRRARNEMNLWRRARRSVDKHISESDAGTEARAEGLKDRFFSGEPSRQAFDSVGSFADLIKLRLHEAAREEGVSWILDPAPQLSDLHEIYAVSDDVHEAALLKVTNRLLPGTNRNAKELGTMKR